MDDMERARMQNEALRQQRISSANRNRFWAGLNRYLGEAEHEHGAEEEREAQAGGPRKKD